MFSNFERAPPAAIPLDDVGTDDHDTDVVLDPTGLADLSDPIMGHTVTYSDDHWASALAVRPLPSPQEPSPAAMARNLFNLTSRSVVHVLCGISPSRL